MSYLAARSIRALKGGIAILMVLMFGLSVVALIYIPMPQENREMLMALFGVLGSNVTTITNNLFRTMAHAGERTSDQ